MAKALVNLKRDYVSYLTPSGPLGPQALGIEPICEREARSIKAIARPLPPQAAGEAP
jgi:hypothetical protein